VTQETTSSMYDTAAGLWLGWIDASLVAQQRLGRMAHVWIDETLAAQQDLTQAMRQSLSETQSALAQDADQPISPLTWISRSGDIARTATHLWTEAALKAQSRYTRVAQTAFDEMQKAQADLSSRAEERMSEFARGGNGQSANATQ
jgi:hypothetical protein